ncbi:response regulator [Bradyrhizobium sp.]|uniref:response regulator n=1 Tax=Bradyrhizobium sp. TaxID=376 RepID=UPI003C7BAF73
MLVLDLWLMELQGLRVFLVEDESLVAMSVEDMLADLGCIVTAQAGSVPEALEKARSGGFDVALLDVSLHGIKVFRVAEFLSDHGIPFAFASGYGRAGLPEAFRTRPVVQKPFVQDELSAALTAAL